MRFGIIDHNDDTGRPHVRQVAETFEGIHAVGHFYAGDPAGAREWVARHRDIGGINYMALETCFGDMTKDEALQSAELLAAEVMPHFA